MTITKKECSVVLLDTTDVTPIVKNNKGSFYYRYDFHPVGSVYQHIYILSDDKIEINDWVIYSGNDNHFIDKVVKIDIDPIHNKVITFESKTFIYYYEGKKIIATTNTELIKRTQSEAFDTNGIGGTLPLLNIQNGFPKQWITKGCPEKIEVDYEEDYIQTWPSSGRDAGGNEKYTLISRLKISENYTLNCNIIEDNQLFTKSQVKLAIHLARNWNPETTPYNADDYVFDELAKIKK